MAFVAEFIINVVRMLAIAAVAFGGIMLGKRLRDRHDAKEAAQNHTSEQ